VDHLEKKMKETIEVVFSFDTTGSMYPCLTQTRRNIKESVLRLFKEIPNIRIGIIAHGDYCDASSSYVTKHFDLSDNATAICNFVERVESTGGGDAEECYELVLHEARTQMSWTSGKKKVLALIGDDVPHGPTYPMNAKKINWRNELGLLLEANINVYGIQALNRDHATRFYEEIAEKTGGFHLNLDQFSHVTDLIMAICYKQAGNTQLQNFEQELVKNHRMNRSMEKTFDTLLERKSKKSRFKRSDLEAVHPGRFQVLDVDRDIGIKEFAEENGLRFRIGRGFYQFTKTSTIQAHKEILLMEKETGDLFTGVQARQLLGLPCGMDVRVKPEYLAKYIPFVQSTSSNRKLLEGTKFLYEVEDWD
jgi:hypothetical protein